MRRFYTSNFGKQGTIYAKLSEGERKWRDTHQHILESYHYIHKESYVEKLRQDNCKVFLDSGAFSAFTKGVEIDIPGYCEYVRKNKDIIEHVDGIPLFSVLDRISLNRAESVKGTYDNQMRMEALGVRPLPCFHYGEDERALEYYTSKYEYITLGGMVPIATKQLYYWLDRLWDRYLTDGSGRPRVRVHGFGLTTVELMERYPWFSVDSSSWVQIAVHGNILIPDNDTMRASVALDKYEKKEKDRNIAISSDSPRRKEQDYHYDTVSPVMQEAIKKYVEAQGFDVTRLKTSAYSRWAWNFFAYNQIELRTTKAESVFRPPGMTSVGAPNRVLFP